MGSPFFWSGAVTDSVSRLSNNGTWAAAILWTLVYALLAVVLLAATLATFNRCLGRVSNHSPSDAAVVLGLIQLRADEGTDIRRTGHSGQLSIKDQFR